MEGHRILGSKDLIWSHDQQVVIEFKCLGKQTKIISITKYLDIYIFHSGLVESGRVNLHAIDWKLSVYSTYPPFRTSEITKHLFIDRYEQKKNQKHQNNPKVGT